MDAKRKGRKDDGLKEELSVAGGQEMEKLNDRTDGDTVNTNMEMEGELMLEVRGLDAEQGEKD